MNFSYNFIFCVNIAYRYVFYMCALVFFGKYFFNIPLAAYLDFDKNMISTD